MISQNLKGLYVRALKVAFEFSVGFLTSFLIYREVMNLFRKIPESCKPIVNIQHQVKIACYDLMTSMSLNGNFYPLSLVEKQTMNNSMNKK